MLEAPLLESSYGHASDPRQHDADQRDAVACQPGLGTLKTKIPIVTLTSRLNWAIVKPTPVPTRVTSASSDTLPIPKSSPAPNCTAVLPGLSLAAPPLVMTRPSARPFRARAGSCRPVPAPWPTAPDKVATPEQPRRAGEQRPRRCLDKATSEVDVGASLGPGRTDAETALSRGL